jgi:hypothetical protein
MYRVIKDSREQKGQGWFFHESSTCEGTIKDGLKTGDYSIEGLEFEFSIERKGTSGEFSHNIIEARFERELARLNKYKWAFVILEFTYQDILDFPKGSGIPPKKWGLLRIKPKFILKKLMEFRLKYPNIIFLLTGEDGFKTAERLMRVVYGSAKKELGT